MFRELNGKMLRNGVRKGSGPFSLRVRMSDPESRKVYANGVKDFSLGLPHGRLPQVRPSQGDLNRNAVPENLRNPACPFQRLPSGTTLWFGDAPCLSWGSLLASATPG